MGWLQDLENAFGQLVAQAQGKARVTSSAILSDAAGELQGLPVTFWYRQTGTPTYVQFGSAETGKKGASASISLPHGTYDFLNQFTGTSQYAPSSATAPAVKL